jgi:hypothetical protein
MIQNNSSRCPRCSAAFICNQADITLCQCFPVELSEQTRAFLAKTSFNCLCKDCLTEMDRQVKTAAAYATTEKNAPLIENIHFYKEGHNWVFTELYHMLRGYCCKNGCRHCPYGYKK